jgi:hypothetical protein
MKKLIFAFLLISSPAFGMHTYDTGHSDIASDGWNFNYKYILNGVPKKLSFFIHKCEGHANEAQCADDIGSAKTIADGLAQWEEDHYRPAPKTKPTTMFREPDAQ